MGMGSWNQNSAEFLSHHYYYCDYCYYCICREHSFFSGAMKPRTPASHQWNYSTVLYWKACRALARVAPGTWLSNCKVPYLASVFSANLRGGTAILTTKQHQPIQLSKIHPRPSAMDFKSLPKIEVSQTSTSRMLQHCLLSDFCPVASALSLRRERGVLRSKWGPSWNEAENYFSYMPTLPVSQVLGAIFSLSYHFQETWSLPSSVAVLCDSQFMLFQCSRYIPISSLNVRI